MRQLVHDCASWYNELVGTLENNRPFVLINVAITVDGKLDTIERHGAPISSTGDKARVDRLRAEADAVMVGGRTLAGDDPQLTLKSVALRAERVARGLSEHPAKVAVVSRPELRPDSKFLTAGPARIILFTTAQVGEAQLTLLRRLGVEVYVLGDTRVDLPLALARLKELGIDRLMVEGGGMLNFELLRQRLVDQLQVYIAPLLFGGDRAPTLAGGLGLPRDQALQLRRTRVEAWDDGGVVLEYAVT